MGFFWKAISALLGERKKEPRESKEGLTEMESAVISPPHVKAKASDFPDEKDGSTIYNLVSRAYTRTAASLAKKMQDRRFMALTGVSLAVLITLLSYTSFFFYVRGVILAVVFILLAAASKLIQKFIPFVVGLDLCLFFTVLFGIAYHPFTGIVVGVASSALGSIARGQYQMDKVIFPLLGNVVVGMLLMIIPLTNIFYVGMAMALVYAVMMCIIFAMTIGISHNTATFFITSIAFNYWLFNNYASYFLMLMGVSG
ncbi:Uncharacterised protein [uncultured archaeon]|nr:Uncharacterised protein [uncultured archaeon]